MPVNDDLQKKLKQSKPFGGPQKAAYLWIEFAAEELRAGFNNLFKSMNLTGVRYNVLRILEGEGKSECPAVRSEIE